MLLFDHLVERMEMRGKVVAALSLSLSLSRAQPLALGEALLLSILRLFSFPFQ